jgi:hypoxia up-regulated 1
MSLLLNLLLSLIPQVNARAILGVDLGSLYMKVALVQSGSPIEIVTNLHSKRKTEQMILFDKGNQRFYGADAAALLARKAHTTPVAMSLMLGRDERHPVVQVRCFLSLFSLVLRLCGYRSLIRALPLYL